MNYPKAIRIARSLADLSQGQLADEAKIDRSYLSLIESGKRQPSIETIEKIAAALKIPFHLLTLLASSETDAKNATVDHIKSLAIELTKLILKVPPDESTPESDPGEKPRCPSNEPSRSRASAVHRPRPAAAPRRRVA
jgi:transcriptional regulator with XRE-family HTH domain